MNKTTGGIAGGVAVIAAAIGAVLLFAHHRPSPPPPGTPRPTVVRSVCHANGSYPDPTCTTGALNPAVTQGTLQTTICVSGWTSTVRPPVSVTGPIKTERMAAYGVSYLPQSDFELDHFVALEIGGATGSHPGDIRNLWPEAYSPVPGAHEKDAVENWLHKQVCDGSMTLADAQTAIMTDWVKVWRQIGSPSSATGTPVPVSSATAAPNATPTPTPTPVPTRVPTATLIPSPPMGRGATSNRAAKFVAVGA